MSASLYNDWLCPGHTNTQEYTNTPEWTCHMHDTFWAVYGEKYRVNDLIGTNVSHNHIITSICLLRSGRFVTLIYMLSQFKINYEFIDGISIKKGSSYFVNNCMHKWGLSNHPGIPGVTLCFYCVNKTSWNTTLFQVILKLLADKNYLWGIAIWNEGQYMSVNNLNSTSGGLNTGRTLKTHWITSYYFHRINQFCCVTQT